MIITDPKTAVKLFKNNEFNYLVNSRKNHRLEAIETLGNAISNSMIDNCIQWIKEEYATPKLLDNFFQI
jgi:hypothetical protein